MQNNQEKVLYEGGPSQMLNYNIFVMCTLLFLAAFFAPAIWKGFAIQYFPHSKAMFMNISKFMFFVPIIWAFSAWVKIRTHRYKVTTERFVERHGVFSRFTSEVELFRVRDISLAEPFSLRVIGCGDVIMDTSDKSNPIVVLHAIKNPRPVMEIIRRNVDIMRTRKGVREIEV